MQLVRGMPGCSGASTYLCKRKNAPRSFPLLSNHAAAMTPVVVLAQKGSRDGVIPGISVAVSPRFQSPSTDYRRKQGVQLSVPTTQSNQNRWAV